MTNDITTKQSTSKSRLGTSGQARSVPSVQASTMSELMSRSSSQFKPLQKGQIVEGVIKKLTSSEILLDIGAKGDALVIEYDKKNLSNLLKMLHEGERVRASVISAESEEGFPVVSLRRTLEELTYKLLEEAYKNNTPISVKVVESGRGGYFAESLSGVRGFLPNSQVLSQEALVNHMIDVKVIECDREKKRVIFSQKAVVYVTDPAKISTYIKQDEVVTVTIQAVTTHGLYVVLEKGDIQIEGFIHISEVSYQRIEDLHALYKAGDKISAQVIDIDTENRRINLSVKSLDKDSFSEVKQKYTKDQEVKAVVTDVKSRGVSVEVEKGLFGFIQASKIPSETVYQKGQTIDAQIVDFDDNKRLVMLVPILKTKFVGYR